MVKILSESKTITESLLDNIMRDVDKILAPLKVKYETDYDGDSVKIEFDDSEAKITKAIRALEKDKYSVLSREGEYWIRFKTPGTDPKSTRNYKLASPKGDGARYWVYKVDTDMYGTNPNYNDIGKVMYVRKDDNCARYQTHPADRKTYTQNSAQRKIDRGNSYGDGRFKWYKIQVESVEESFDTHNPNVEYLNSIIGKYVPSRGKCDTKLGEIVRAVGRIVYRYLNDGDFVGVGYGKETCSSSAAYLADNTDSGIRNMIMHSWGITSEELYEDHLQMLVDEVAEYVRENYDDLVSTDNTDDSREWSVGQEYSKYDYPDEDDSDDDYWDDDDEDDYGISDEYEEFDFESVKVPTKSLRESIELTEHVQELGDVIDGFIGNMEDDDIDFTIALYKKVARILGVRDYNRVVVSVEEEEIDPLNNDQVKMAREDIKTSKKVIKMVKYTVATDPAIVFIREQCPETGRIYLYFTSEEDYDRYVEIVRSTLEESRSSGKFDVRLNDHLYVFYKYGDKYYKAMDGTYPLDDENGKEVTKDEYDKYRSMSKR